MKKGCFLIIIIILTLIIPSYCFGYTENQSDRNGKVIMVIINRISLNDLIEARVPNIDRLIKENGSIGVMNTNTGGAKTPENCSLTISSGTRGRAPSEIKGFNSWEVYLNNSADALLYQMSGTSLNSGSIGIFNLQEILSSNASLHYRVVPGALGESLKNAGLKSAAIGNADTVLGHRRHSALIAMDANGIIPSGDISSNCLTEDPLFPYALRTDYEKIFNIFKVHLQDNDFIVIETGDTSRLEDYKSILKPSIYKKHKQKALIRSDELIGKIIENIDLEKDLLIIASITPSIEMIQRGNNLTPIIIAGKNYDKGMLISTTTRRNGLITNIDIPSAIASFFNINAHPTVMGGRLSSITSDNPLEVKHLESKSLSNYIYRPIIIKTYIGFQIVIFLSALCFLLIKKNPFPKLVGILKSLMPVIASVPLALLLISPLSPSTLYIFIIYLFLIITVITIIAHIPIKKDDTFIMINALTFLFIIFDVIAGSPLMKTSVLGYCPIIGGRFYGIGNEYMGILIGSLITGSTLFIDRYKTEDNTIPLLITAVFYILTVYVMASPALGANVGGTITAALALFFTYLKISGKKITVKELVCGAILTTCIILLLVYFDITRVENTQSHVGKTIELIKNNGIFVIKDTIQRKLSANIRIFKYTIWTRILVVFVITFATIFYKPSDYLKNLIKKYPYTVMGWSGCLIASLAALVFNDSGVAPAASCLIFPGSLAVYMMLDEKFK